MKVMEVQVSEHSNGSNNHHHSLSDNLAVEMHISRHIETSIRILLVDDYVILRQGICALLSEEDDFEIVGEAGTEKAALMLAMELQPDIVLLDSSLETSNGLNVAKQLLRSCSKHVSCYSPIPMMKNFFSMLYVSAYMAICQKQGPLMIC